MPAKKLGEDARIEAMTDNGEGSYKGKKKKVGGYKFKEDCGEGGVVTISFLQDSKPRMKNTGPSSSKKEPCEGEL